MVYKSGLEGQDNTKGKCMNIKDAIGYIIDTVHDGLDWINSYIDQKLGKDRSLALLKAIFLILVAAFVFFVYLYIQSILDTRHYNRIVRAERQYDAAGLHNDHYGGNFYYGRRDYESAVLNYVSFINKFPSILYTEPPHGLDAKKPEKMDEAIIKVLLSLRRLNRHYEISNHVSRFKKRFPKSKAVPLLDLYKTGLSSLYSERWDLLNLAQSLDQEAIKELEVEDYEAAVDRSRIAAERRELARNTFEAARSAFEELSSHPLLNNAPYSEFKGESLYFLAKSYLIEGNYTRAYQEFDKIATAEYRNYPDLQDDVMYYTAYCLKQRAIYDEAFGRYSEFMVRFPNSEYVTDAYYDLGKIYAFRKEYNSARGSYTSGLQRERHKSRQVKEQLKNARISYENGNKTKTEIKTKEAEAKAKEVEGKTKESEAIIKKVDDKIKEAEIEYENAIRIYRALLTKYPEDFFLSETLNFNSELPRKLNDWNEGIDGKITEFESFVKKHGQERSSGFQAEIGRAYYDEGIDDNKLGNDAKSRDAYNEAITAYKLLLDEYPQSNRAPLTKLLIANIYNKLNEHSKSIEAYTRILDDYESDYGEENELISVTIKGSPKVTDLRAFCVYEIAVAHQEKQDYEKALEWYKKIFVENEFKHNGSAVAVDLSRDPLAPDALYDAMRSLSELGRNEELYNIATTYIEDLRKDAPLLSAEAQLNFAHIQRNEFKEYHNAAQEYKKLSKGFEINENGDVFGYLPDPDLRFNLIRLHGKYYEGLCYEKSYNQEDIDAESAADVRQEITMLFKTTFQPLINAPNIDDIPYRDYYITEATRIFEDLVNRHPTGKDAAYWRSLAGEFYFAKKEFEKAIIEYQKVLKDYPASNYIKAARDRIEEIQKKLGNKIDRKLDSSTLPNNSKMSKPSTARVQFAQDIAEISAKSTVFLAMRGNRDGTGSGFFVAPGLVATNFHVVKGKTSGTVRLFGTDKEFAIVGYTAIDVERDLAILKVRAFGVKPLLLGNGDDLQVNDDVYAVGNPLGLPYLEGTVSYGKVSGIREGPTLKWIQMTAPMTHGNSGGPVLNSRGEVIGISTVIVLDTNIIKYDVKDTQNNKMGYVELPRRREQNLNFAVSVNHLKVLINRVAPPKPLSELAIVY